MDPDEIHELVEGHLIVRHLYQKHILLGRNLIPSYIFVHFLSPQIFRLQRLTFRWILALCIPWVRHEVSSCLLLWWKWSGEFVGVGLAEWKGSLQFHGFEWIFILMLVALVLFAWNIIPLGCCVIKISQIHRELKPQLWTITIQITMYHYDMEINRCST